MKQFRKLMSIVLAVILLLPVFSIPAFARDEARYTLPFDANAQSYILVSLDTGEIIFEKNMHERLPMASTTKVMTALLAIENGVDQFGGNNDIRPVLKAYEIGCARHGEKAMRARFEQSAVRLLMNSFRCGLFENPYLDPQESAGIVGCGEHCEAGMEAQLRSIVLLKNSGVLPVPGRRRVYIPGRTIGDRVGFFREPIPACSLPGADARVVEKYFDWADSPQEADFAIVFIESPITDGGYSAKEGYHPISLQYRPYTAHAARAHSIAQGDFRETENPDRGYRGKRGTAANERDLDLVLETRRAMGDKPVIVVIRMNNPCVLAELEPAADAILVDFGVQLEAMLRIISGGAEPSGLLPVQLPADMETVERHCEDRPLDLSPYVDSAKNAYDFGFGLSWRGPIRDRRAARYAADETKNG